VTILRSLVRFGYRSFEHDSCRLRQDQLRWRNLKPPFAVGRIFATRTKLIVPPSRWLMYATVEATHRRSGEVHAFAVETTVSGPLAGRS